MTAVSATASSSDVARYRTVNVEELAEGDTILAQDPKTGRLKQKRVVRVYRRLSDHLRVLQVRGPDGTVRELETTDEHPFWVARENDFKVAGQLQPRDEFRGPQGEVQRLVSTRREEHPEGVPVFNLETEDYHTYFVAPHGTAAPPLLVHNNCDVRATANRIAALEQPRNALGEFMSRSSPGQAIPGSAPVDDFAAQAKCNGFDVLAREVTVNTPFGQRRYDLVIQNRTTGAVTGVEIKSSHSAFVRFDEAARHQFAADRWLRAQGGLQAVGKYRKIFIEDAIKILWEIP